jgi:hypothetical protein
MVVLALTGVVAVPILNTIQSAFRTERSMTAELDVEQEVRFALDRFEADGRSGAIAAAGAGDPSRLLVLETIDGGVVLWTLVDGELRRGVGSNPPAATADATAVVSEVAAGSSFTYFTPDEVAISPSDDATARCVRRIRLSLVLGDGDERSIDVTSRRPTDGTAPC